jgi:hypothetical protein
MSRKQEIDKLEEVLDQTLRLISLYKRSGLTVPFALKGNLGEFIAAMELLRRFPTHKVDYRGGAYPRTDVSIDDIKIQVKTQFKHLPTKFRNGEFDFESSPTISSSTIDKKTCDILILSILYLNEDYSEIKKQNIYVFDQEDFKHFSHKFCWTGRSKGDYTIVNILSVKGKPPTKLREKIDFYNRPHYRELFQESKDCWSKVETLLHAR